MSSLPATPTYDGSEIAIIGLACRFPGAPTSTVFWDNLRQGVESITPLSEAELRAAGVDPALLANPHYVKVAPLLDGIDQFDAAFFGYTPLEAQTIDPQQRLLLECAWEALEHAGYDPQRLTDPVGVYAGARMNTYIFNLFSNPDFLNSQDVQQSMISSDLAYLSTRIAYKMNLRGPSFTVQTACSSALVAVHLACQSLLNGECVTALAGGVAINVPDKVGHLYQDGSMLSPDGHCRAFDANAQGTIFGNGLGIVVLKQLDDALADGDTIHAIIKGSAINNDGSLKASFTAPSVEGQTEVILEAQASAHIKADTISYVEAHGTGTPLGDPIEVLALTNAFRASTQRRGFCALGSVKTNIGHLDAAAGISSLIKTVLALKHRQLPPSLNFTQPNPQIDFAASPFYVNTTLRPWPTHQNGQPRRAGVSAFGFGGTNAHVILEEAPPVIAASAPAADGPQLLVLSARTETALDTATAQLQAALAAQPDLALTDVAWTLQQGRMPLAYRRTVVVHDHTDAVAALANPSRWTTAYQDGPVPRVAFLLPGQGAALGTLVPALYAQQPVFRQQLDALCQQLLPRLDRDLRALLLPTPTDADAAATALQATALQQPALFAVQYVLAQLWQAWGIRPQALLGHSLGELVTATLAGVFTLDDALALVVRRGQLMQATAPGALLAVALDEAAVQPYLSPTVALAAVNGPRQCVLSGPTATMMTLAAQLTVDGHEVRQLPGTVAFHSSLMASVQTAFAEAVAAVPRRAPQLPVLSNVTGTWLTAAHATDPAYWGQHLRAPVRFADGLATLLADDAPVVLLELGPGRTLSSLARHHPAVRADQIVSAGRHPQEATTDAAALLGALGRVWGAGVNIDWAALHHHAPRRRVPLPTYPFERQRFWVDPLPRDTPAPDAPPIAGKQPDLTRWFYLPSWTRTPLPLVPDAAADDAQGSVLCFEDAQGLAAALADHLAAAGHTIIQVQAGTAFAQLSPTRYTLRPDQPTDYHALLQALAATATLPHTILHAWSLDLTHPPATAASFAPAQARGYYSLLFLAQALDAAGRLSAFRADDPLTLRVLTTALHEVAADDVLHPEQAPLLGLSKVLPQEYRNLTCQVLDVGPLPTPAPPTLRAHLHAELHTSPTEPVVAYRGRHRWVPTFHPQPLPATAPPVRTLRTQGVYLITGGLGNVGLLLADYLARTFQARLVLVGRSGLPPRRQWERWLGEHAATDGTSTRIRAVQALEAQGAEVLVVRADVADATQLEAVLEHAEQRFGTLHGVLHAAGVTSGKSIFSSIKEIGEDESETQFGPKVYGVYALAEVLAGRTLDFCLLFSSNAAVLGGLGFAAYTAANLFMDAFATAAARTTVVPWISANWDEWPREAGEDGMQTSMDKYAMTRQEGITAFERVVTLAASGQIVVSTGHLEPRVDLWIRQTNRHTTQADAAAALLHPRPKLRDTFVAPRNKMEQTVAEIWQQTMAIEQIGIHDDFFQLGGHSMLVVQIVGQLRDVLKVDLPVKTFFEQPTVAGLAQAIEAIRRQVMPDEPLIDLEQEVHLDPSIAAHGLTADDTASPTRIFLTGTTGFVGAFLLRELLEQTQATIYCLVRALTPEEGNHRIKQTVQTYLPAQTDLFERIVVVCGDLAQPHLGLSDEQFTDLAHTIDVIYHAGAWVDTSFSYAVLKATNVLGTQEILKLATHHKLKPVHYLSSLSVLNTIQSNDLCRFDEGTASKSALLPDGYSQSKWVAEQLLQVAAARGLPVWTYRIGHIIGHSTTGACSANSFLGKLLKACLQTEAVPDMELPIDLTPIDYISQAIVQLSQQPFTPGTTFHVVNPQMTPWSRIVESFQALGNSIQPITSDKWDPALSDLLERTLALHPLLATFTTNGPLLEPPVHGATLEYDWQNTRAGLAETGIECPVVSVELLTRCLRFCIESGIVAAPRIPSSA